MRRRKNRIEKKKKKTGLRRRRKNRIETKKTQRGHKDTGGTQKHRRERLTTDISGVLKGN